MDILRRVYKPWSVAWSVAWSVVLGPERPARARRRSFMGSDAWAMGGVGSCALADDEAALARCDEYAGVAMSDCNDRQVVMMLLRAVADERVGGLDGGEK